VRCEGDDVRVVASAYGTFRSHGVGRNALHLRRMSNAYSIVVTEFMTYPPRGQVEQCDERTAPLKVPGGESADNVDINSLNLDFTWNQPTTVAVPPASEINTG
jgi:hypothetical protein